MKVKSLDTIDFEVLMECFLRSFENYYVKMPTNYNYYKNRWKAAGVNYDLSFGMFDNNKLVGFIMNAIDKHGEDIIAFNTGTGVIPEYRGKRIVKSIYDYAIPILIERGITKCQLEVITENEKAFKTYKSIGFNIYRTLKCFGGELSKSNLQIQIKEIDFKNIDWSKIPNQDSYSWDFRKSVLKKGVFKYYKVYNEGNLESYFSLNHENGTINQLEVFKDDESTWDNLFSAIGSIAKKVRIINVDDRLKSKITAIEKASLKNTVNQYEMELSLENQSSLLK